jgi:HK97 family phage major capsid protein
MTGLSVNSLKQERGALIQQMTALTESREFDPSKFASLESEADRLEIQIRAAEAVQRRQTSLARPANSDALLSGNDPAAVLDESPIMSPWQLADAMSDKRGAAAVYNSYFLRARKVVEKERGFVYDPSKHFRSLGEQLQSVFDFYASKGTRQDARLVRAPTGASEVDPTGGGFLVQLDFAASVFMLAHDMGEVLSRVNKIPISPNANGIKIPGVDETSRVTGSRWGGVQSYWVGEGTAATPTKPKFRLIEFDLKKLMSTMYTTEEMLQDSTALSSIAGQAFSEEIMFMTEDAIFRGSGAGQPLGFLNAPCKVQVNKETGQAAKTIVKENVDDMWSRCWARSRKNAVWMINQDIEPQLNALNQAVGTGGNLVYLPPGGLSAAPYASLYGRPVIAVEYCDTLGSEGDIVISDFSQYTLADKNGIQAATSMHVAFLTDEWVFRITYRVDGKPMWHAPLTPYKGSNTKSPFVTLASRQ